MASLSSDAQHLISLRVLRIAKGGRRARKEMARMIVFDFNRGRKIIRFACARSGRYALRSTAMPIAAEQRERKTFQRQGFNDPEPAGYVTSQPLGRADPL